MNDEEDHGGIGLADAVAQIRRQQRPQAEVMNEDITQEQYNADVALLNEYCIHVVVQRGHKLPLDRKTVHALAEVIRAWQLMSTPKQ